MNKEIITAIVKYIESYKTRLNIEYQWKIPENRDLLNDIFELKEFFNNKEIISLPLYKQNLELRLLLHNVWEKSNKKNFNILIWYVEKWGGINRFSKDKNPNRFSKRQETLKNFIRDIQNNKLVKAEKGVATWSKILCIVDPEKYAIYDARVAFSLNAIQLLSKIREPVFFPKGLSNNKKIKESYGFLNSKFKDWPKLRKEIFYDEYITLLRKSGVGLQEAEMILFSRAPILADVIKVYYGKLFVDGACDKNILIDKSLFV